MPVGAVGRTAEVNLASWRADGALDGDRSYPWGTFPAGVGLLVNLGEVAVHAWDLAEATGQRATIDEDTARRLVVRGFFASIIGRIGVPGIEEHLMDAIDRELEGTA